MTNRELRRLSRVFLDTPAPRRLGAFSDPPSAAAGLPGLVCASDVPIGPFRCLGLLLVGWLRLKATKRGRWIYGTRFAVFFVLFFSSVPDAFSYYKTIHAPPRRRRAFTFKSGLFPFLLQKTVIWS